MKRAIVLGAIVAVAGASITLAGQQGIGARGRGGAQPPVTVEKLAETLYLLTGAGGSTAVFITSRGVVLVDTGLPGFGLPLLAAVRTVTDKPVTTVINTHVHGDHVLGQLEFPMQVEYVSHENTRLAMTRTPQFQHPEGAKKLPTRTYTNRMTLFTGPDRVELYYFGPAHTNGDAWVVFPSVGVMHAGDAVRGQEMPLVDTTFGGSGLAYPKTLRLAYTSIRNVHTVITGHSRTMTWSEFKDYVDFNDQLLTWTRAQMKAGKTPEQAAGEYRLPDRFASYSPGAQALFGGLAGYVNAVYTELRNEEQGRKGAGVP